MSVKKHPDYKEEVKRLEYTKDYVNKVLDATEKYRETYKQNIKDAMVELDYLDSSQSYISIILNTKFMEIADRNYDNLYKVKDKPYFARVDFKKKGSDKVEKLYIGKTSLMRVEDEIPLIIDWRSPIANIYYEGRLGEVSYKSETGVEEGEVLLKRQFTIEDGKLENILDIDITTNDSFLQASLSANVDNRLKDIASTIQAEQNKVIRADIGKPLIVQGVAGSGKTTIALHRIAYFIYTYEKTFDSENFMIIAPNKMFINYISEVLPELGVENVKQTTYIDFMIELLGNKYKLNNKNEILVQLIKNNNEEVELLKWMISFKGSLDYKEIMDNYIKSIEDNFIPNIDFKLGDYVLVSYNKIRDMFLKDFNYLPFYKRIKEIEVSLKNQLKYQKDEILREIEHYYNTKIDDLRDTMEESEERRQLIVSLIDERDNKLNEIKKSSRSLVKKYLSNFVKKDLFQYYKDLVGSEKILCKYSNGKLSIEQLKFFVENCTKLLNKKKLQLEDYAPLVYLKHKIFGFDKDYKISSVVIDEAQDFGLFEFHVLKEVLKTNMFTILGDLSQGIHSYRAIKSWDDVIKKIFKDDDANYMTLVQSYRTTVEIMNFANKIIQKLNDDKMILAKPVIRHGEEPEVKKYSEKKELIQDIENNIIEMKKQRYKSIALICKTLDECKKLKKYLDKNGRIEAKVISEKDESYDGGIVIVPSYIAKGLEFDVVVITAIEEDYKENDLDIKLLYVAITRALHQLFIYHMDDKMELLQSFSF